MANSIGKPAEKPSVQPPGSAVKPAEAITKPGEIAPAGGDTIAPHTAKLQESGGLTAPLKPGDNAQEVAQKTANQQLEAQGLKGVVRTDSSNPINAPLKPEQTANVRVQTDTSKPGMTQGQIDAANKAAAARAPESAVKPGDTATKPGMTQGQIDAANKAAAARAPESAVKPGDTANKPAGMTQGQIDAANKVAAARAPETAMNPADAAVKPGMTQGQIDAANKAAAARAPETAVKPGDATAKPGMTQGQIDAANKVAAAQAPETAVKPGDAVVKPGMTQGQIDAANKAAAARAPETTVKPGDPTVKPGMTQGQIDAANKVAAARAPESTVKPGDALVKPGMTQGQVDAANKAAAARAPEAARPADAPRPGMTQGQIDAANKAAAARAPETARPADAPRPGMTQGQIDAANKAAAARAPETARPADASRPGMTQGQIDAANKAAAARTETARPGDAPRPGMTQGQIDAANKAAAARAPETARPGDTAAKPGMNQAQVEAANKAALARGEKPVVADVKPEVRPEAPRRADNPTLTGPERRAEAVRENQERKAAKVEARADARTADKPPVKAPAEGTTPPVTSPRAERLATIEANKAAREARKAADPAAPPTDNSPRNRPRAEVPANPVPSNPSGDATRGKPPVKAETPVRAETPAPVNPESRPRVPRSEQPTDTAKAPKVAETPADPRVRPADNLGEPRNRPGREPRLDTAPDGKPLVPGKDLPQVPGADKGRPLVGDQLPKMPASDLLSDKRGPKSSEPPAPLDARQQRFLDQMKAQNPNGPLDPKIQNFRDNFEKLSPQNRTALMNMDGQKQLDMIAKLSRERVNPNAIEKGLAGDRGLLTGSDLAKNLTRADLKIPGLDLANPSNKQFLLDASNRFNQLKLDGTNANMKVSDVLKGLDPQKVSALEKFLTTNTNLDATKLTLGQLDGMKFNQLMKGNFDSTLTGRQLTPQDALRNLTQQFTTGDGTNPLNTLGRTLNNMGDQPGRLSELVVRTMDSRSPGAGTGVDLGGLLNPGRMQGEFTARLNPLQELSVRNMIENSSRVLTQLDSSMGRMDFSARGDMVGPALGLSQVLATTFGESRGDFAVRGDVRTQVQQQADAAVSTADASSGPGKSQEYISKLPIDATTGLPYDPSTGKLLDPNTGRPVGDKAPEGKKSAGQWDEKEESEEKEKKKQKKESDIDDEKAKQKAMLLILQAKKKREQELREKQLKDEKQKKEDEQRIKYICKDGDTIQTVALRQLRDNRVAPLIYSINKQVIPTKIINGETVPLLSAGLVIWLPSPKEIREFRSKLVSGTAGQAQTTGQKFASAEDELAARFGNWDGKTGQSEPSASQQKPMSDVERKLMEDAMAEAKRRRENIEKALGPITGTTTRSARTDGEHITYQVRLGDTLRSVATKHPSIGDVNLWRLLAEINDLSTDVDVKGQPKAGLARGSKINIPTAAEIAAYRQRVGSMAGQPMSREHRVAKNCPKCGRMTVISASLCPCGHEFELINQAPPATANKDAATLVMEAKTDADGRREGSQTEELDSESLRTEDLDSGSTPTTLVGQNTANTGHATESNDVQDRAKEVAAYVETGQNWAMSKDFESDCRLTKSALSWDSAEGKLVIHLQLRNDENGQWFPILEYEIYGPYSIRHTIARQTGAKKTVKIDLPAAAAMELAQNDLLANWANYKKKYMDS